MDEVHGIRCLMLETRCAMKQTQTLQLDGIGHVAIWQWRRDYDGENGAHTSKSDARVGCESRSQKADGR